MTVKELTPQQLQEKLESDPDSLLLLDCREQQEYELVRLEGARLIPMSELAERVEEIRDYQDQPIAVYCHHGVRSQRVAHWLAQQGFSDVSSLAGGIDRWSLEVQPSLPRY